MLLDMILILSIFLKLLLHCDFHVPMQVERGNREAIKASFCENVKIHRDSIKTTIKANEHQVHVWFHRKKN